MQTQTRQQRQQHSWHDHQWCLQLLRLCLRRDVRIATCLYWISCSADLPAIRRQTSNHSAGLYRGGEECPASLAQRGWGVAGPVYLACVLSVSLLPV